METLKQSNIILIVDDNRTNRQMLALMLEESGYEVVTAKSGEDALAMLENRVPELILLDVLMPGMDGYETCKNIKALSTFADTPVIFISGEEDVSNKVKAFESGGVDYITKPFQSEEVIARVKTHLNLFRLQNGLSRKNRELEENRRVILEQQEMLTAQSRMAAMGEMLSLIAHHWRQPLSVISTIATNLQLRKQLGNLDDAMLDESLDRVVMHVQSLSKTIDNFRVFFKPGMISDTSLHTICDKTMMLIERVNETYDIEMDINPCDTLDTEIRTYENELIQVYVNIIQNAIDALREKKIEHPRITVKCGHDADNITSIISDNAGGIEQKKIDEIFLPYHSTKAEQVGTGLGLYMSKMMIEKHCQGTLEAYNTDEGAAFKITIPRSIKE